MGPGSPREVRRAPMQGRGWQEKQEIGYVQRTDQINKYLKGNKSRFLTIGTSSYNYDRKTTQWTKKSRGRLLIQT